MSGEIVVRPMRPADDAEVAALIRAVMPEYGAGGPGFAIHDPEVDAMSAAYPGERAQYFVVERAGRVLGGGGFGPLAGGPDGVCELRKMYFLPELRGLGYGGRLLDLLLERAAAAGFSRCYLETLESMVAARALYERVGFRPRGGALGATGHFGCDRFYELELA